MRTIRSVVPPIGAGVLIVGSPVAGALPAAAQHGPDEGHLLDPITPQPDTDGRGDWGNIEFVGKLTVSDAEPELIADVTAFGNYAYLARWGGSECAGPEGGVYVIDASACSTRHTTRRPRALSGPAPSRRFRDDRRPDHRRRPGLRRLGYVHLFGVSIGGTRRR
jgi:hypothetical protein